MSVPYSFCTKVQKKRNIRKTEKRYWANTAKAMRREESGNIRSIKTLSGGESFKAALSLALGLSRMVQDYAGGIELNTLFIDEGFGSLDSQSLDQAMNCLMELHHENKLIGIISHVSDLKDRIERQLVVERKQKQSVIQMI